MTPPTTEADETGALVGHIQTDTFCEHCGYNLHTQKVIRDERLGILICRCTECGRWAAAGKGTTAGNVWLSRFGTMLLTMWVFFLLFIFGLSTLFLCMLAYGHMQEQVYYSHVGGAGNVYHYSLTPNTDPDRSGYSVEYLDRRATHVLIIRITSAVLSSIVGGMAAVFLWHVKGKQRLLALMVPLLGCAIALFIFIEDSMAVELHAWAMRQVGLIFLFDITAALAGLALGRPIARQVLRLFVPPKPRQHLAFLWTVDGKHLAV